MPPKSGKKKLTKAEKEKLKKEETERKAREEEEARVHAEREEADKKVQDKLEAEEGRKLENEERKKRKGQLLELDSIWDSNRSTLYDQNTERRRRDKWARYMKCDGSPDPTNQGEINAYMNLWKEDLENISITTVLKDSQLTLSLIEELVFVMDDTPTDEMTDSLQRSHKNTLKLMQALLQEKLDLASHDLFLKATELQNSETLNLQEVVGNNDDITLCCWGNLSKNPRIKSYEFEETGVAFEIPRVLTLSDCGVRVLFTQYDHYSAHSESYSARSKRPTEAEQEEGGEVEEAAVVEQLPEAAEEGGEQAEGEGEEAVNREETQTQKKDVMAALNALDGDEEEKLEEPEEKEEEEPMEEDIEIKTPEPEDFEDFDGDEDALDLRAYHVLGGIFHFNLIHLPPQPKTANNWLITKIVDPPALQYMDYISDTVNAGTTSAEPKKSDEQKEKKDADKPPIGVTINESGGTDTPPIPGLSKRIPLPLHVRLPEKVYFSEEPQVVRWDPEDRQWRLDGFSDHKFDEEKRILSFKTSYFGTMALVQDIHINMPFQSWELRPRDTNHAQLTIIAAVIEVEIQIKDNQCCLTAPEDKPELTHLLNQWLPVSVFIKKMKAAGLNVFPTCDSSKYVSIQSKNPVTEERMYQQMALVASSMAFSWSKWNTEVPDLKTDRVLLQVHEQLQDEPLLEEDWSVWMMTKKRTTALKMTEFDEEFSADHAEGTEFNADMYHMTMELCSEDAKERICNTSHDFIDSVYTMLSSIKVLTYS